MADDGARPARPRIVFVSRSLAVDWPDIGRLDEASLEAERARFRRGIENWIVQGYLRLRRALEAMGFEVSIADRFARGAICIAHRDDLNRYGDPLFDCFVIAARADRPPVHVAQIEVVQNALQLRGASSVLIPHWPQPGLVARDANRGARVARAVYYGRESGAPAWYRDATFRDRLAALGVSFEVCDTGWHDYHEVDVLLAHREETPVMLANKPASKLVNAWLAGVPAVTAPEPAFMALRKSDLDFIATTDAASTIDAIASLARDAERYRAMVDNGRTRARAFDVEAIRREWLALIVDVAVPAWERWRQQPGGALARYVPFLVALSAQKIDAKRFRAQERREKRALP
jgi:hypothetical protein